MGITFRKTKKGVTVKFEEMADIIDAPEFLSYLKENKGKPVTIDMSEAEHIHTSVYQIIIALSRESRRNERCLRLISPPQALTHTIFQEGAGQWLRIN